MPSVRERVGRLPEAERQAYEAAAERFEESWGPAADGPPDISAFLPATEPVRTLVLVHCVKCDMELRRQRGELPPVADYFARFPELTADPEAQLSVILWSYRL